MSLRIIIQSLICILTFSIVNGEEGKLIPQALNQASCLGFVYETKIGNDVVRLPFAIFLPKVYEVDKNRRFPMILFLHGAGEGGIDLNGVFIHGPCGVAVRTPAMLANLPFIVISPQSTQGWSPLMLKTVASMLRILPNTYRIDRDRIMVTGLSMGGLGSWVVLAEAPDLYAAAVPICGRPWREPDVVTEKLQNCSIWNIVGGADSADFVNGSKIMHTALVKKGVYTQLMIVPNIGHWVWMLYYKNPEFYHWVIRQVRPTTEMQTQAENFRKLQNKENGLVVVVSAPLLGSFTRCI